MIRNDYLVPLRFLKLSLKAKNLGRKRTYPSTMIMGYIPYVLTG